MPSATNNFPDSKKTTAIIIGAGPAGLTAAYELLTKTDIIPIIIEADRQVGGISKTIDYKGNKIDIGGHRFFSKSKRVLDWWLHFMPLESEFNASEVELHYQNQKISHIPGHSIITDENKVMLVRKRKSRIFYQKKLFDYPLSLSGSTLSSLGLVKTMKTGLSYFYAKIFPVNPELTLEEFFINRFGKELYETFFKTYTEKVWGVPCDKIPASWGRQRVKNLNIGKLVGHAIKTMFKANKSIDQKGTSTSLIEQFLYPKFGPGQMWETVAAEITKLGGKVLLNTAVTSVTGDASNNIRSVEYMDLQTGIKASLAGDYFFSTMPIKELFNNMPGLTVPEEIKKIAGALEYRDFLIVGILADRLVLNEKDGSPITDNWIYIQGKNIEAGRLQFFHNWSPFMISGSQNKWIGVEYFCNNTDALWNLPDQELSAKAIAEMETIGIVNRVDVKDTLVVRVKNAYPSYHGAYKDFDRVQHYLNTIENLFPIGRNGMHRYNNSDHSMLTAMAAVENIISGQKDKTNIWEINTEENYHEES